MFKALLVSIMLLITSTSYAALSDLTKETDYMCSKIQKAYDEQIKSGKIDHNDSFEVAVAKLKLTPSQAKAAAITFNWFQRYCL